MSNQDNQKTADHVPELVTVKTLTERFGLTKKGVAALPIPRVQLGTRAVRYRLSDVLAFIKTRTRNA